MTSELKVEDLENSLIARARELAREYQERAKRSHDHFIEDENDRLQLREEREIMAAKIQADRSFRSMVQSSELKVQKKLDQLRWQLIKDTVDSAREELAKIQTDQQRYTKLLVEFIKENIQIINDDHLIIEFNEKDYLLFKDIWTDITATIKDKNLSLSTQYHHMSGGLMIYNHNRTLRIDNTLEGRLARLSSSIHQMVAHHYFSEISHEGEKLHGR